jgi:hypothetical protein
MFTHPSFDFVMPRTIRFCAASFILFSVLLVGCGKKASDEIDFGTFNKSTYTNKYFGVTVTVPSNWSVQDREAQERIKRVGSAAVAGDDKNLKAVLKASELQTVQLFTVFQHPLGTPVTFNPSIMGTAEMVRQMPGIQSGKDYHFQVKKTLQAGQLEISFPKESYTERVSGVEFDVMDQELRIRGLVVKQRYYTIIKKGYALSFILSFTTDEDEASVHKVLETISFR